MPFEWRDKVVAVTGAAAGIGAGVVRLALQEGAKHVAILDIDEGGAEFSTELNARFGGGASAFHRCDVTRDEQLAAALRAVHAHGGLDLLVNNAGIMNDAPNVYKKEIEVNVKSIIHATATGRANTGLLLYTRPATAFFLASAVIYYSMGARMSCKYDWQNKVVLITGAATGIGAGIARMALEEGAKHIAFLDVDKAAGESFQKELDREYGTNRSQFHLCDVTNDDQLFAAFDSCVGSQGAIDVVINSAGIMNDAPDVYKKEIAINLTALITSTLKALELMRVSEGGKGGTIINISSVGGLLQTSFTPIYCATKAAVQHFSNCLAMHEKFAVTGVRIITVCFGSTDTSLNTVAKFGCHDNSVTPEDMYHRVKARLYTQKVESAARGVIEAYRRGRSGSTWVATRDLPVRDITENITRAYQIMGEHNSAFN